MKFNLFFLLNETQRILQFVVALTLLLVSPILMAIFPAHDHIVMEVIFSLVVISGTRILIPERRNFQVGLALGLLAVVAIGLTLTMPPTSWMRALRMVAILLFLGFITYRLFRIFFFQKSISLETMLIAAAGYFLLGIIGGQLCGLLNLALPGSFSTDGVGGSYQMIYFSLTTLTTLGYGDVTPATPPAQSLALMIGIAGQFYLTFLVAILVGKYLNKK